MDELDLDHLRIDVTDEDVAVARRLWLAARDDGAPASRVALLFGDLCRVISAQAQQIAEEFRSSR